MLEVRGATAAGPGHLKLTTGEATVVACDVLGKIEFQAPAECGTDAITIAARIAAIAQGTFSATVNATDLVFYTGHSECAAEKIRFTSQGEIGIGGANYGTDGQVLTSGGAGAAVAWEDAGGGAVSALNNATANELVTVGATTTELCAEAGLTFNATTLSLQTDTGTGNTAGLNIMNSGAASACRKSFIRFAQNRTTGGETSTAWLWGNLSTISCSGYRGNINFATASNGAPTKHVVMDSYGMVHVNDCANGKMTQGVSINQAGNDNEILAFKSSDVAHGMTGVTETDTYGFIKKLCANAGGLIIAGATDCASSTQLGLMLRGYALISNDKDANAHAPVEVRSTIRCSTGTTCTSNMNVFSINRHDNGNALFVVDLEGDFFYYGSGSCFDEYCDAGLVRAFSTATARSQGRCHQIIRNKWDDHVKENEETLVRLGILGDYVNCVPPCRVGLVNGPQLQRLHNGAIWQLHSKLEDQGEEIKELQTQLKALNGGK